MSNSERLPVDMTMMMMCSESSYLSVGLGNAFEDGGGLLDELGATRFY